MAQIEWRTIKKVDKDKCAVHEKVQATYSVFEKTGQKLLLKRNYIAFYVKV